MSTADIAIEQTRITLDSNLEEFRKEFLENVKARAVVEGDFMNSSYISEAAKALIDAEEFSDFEPCYFDGSGQRNRKLRVDGYSFDDVDGSVRLVIADYRGGDVTETLIQSDAKRSFSALKNFVEESLTGRLYSAIEESSPGYGLASGLFNRNNSITRIRLYLVTDAILSTRVQDWPEETLLDRAVEFHIWDMGRFYRVASSSTGRDELEVVFSEFLNDGIPCVEASRSQGDYRSFLCVIPGKVLAAIYERYGSRLLEGNVRSFLSTKGKVNKNIRNTIINEAGMFFAYNNGISTTATSAETRNTDMGLRLVNAKYLQIVNGGQTTASLAYAKRKDNASLDGIFVQMKLSVITPEDAETVIPRIAYCANSQNKVSEADFFSNHPFHIRMEKLSRRIWAPATGGAQHETHWFYERARGQFLNDQAKLSPADKRTYIRQFPREQLFSKTDLAKFENTWRRLPHIVSLGAQKNFLCFAQHIGEQWKVSESDFNEEYFRNAIVKAILFRYTDVLAPNNQAAFKRVLGPGLSLNWRSAWLGER